MRLDRWDYAASFGHYQGKTGQNHKTAPSPHVKSMKLHEKMASSNCFSNSCFCTYVRCFNLMPLPPHPHVLHSHIWLLYSGCMLRSYVNSSSSQQDYNRKLKHGRQNGTILYEVATGTRWSLQPKCSRILWKLVTQTHLPRVNSLTFLTSTTSRHSASSSFLKCYCTLQHTENCMREHNYVLFGSASYF